MNKNKKIIVIIVIVITLLIVVSSTTYAFWRWQSSSAQKTNVTFTATPEFSCSADAGGNISSANTSLAPTSCTDSDHAIKREIVVNTSINGNDSVYLSMNLKVNSIDSGLYSTYNFKYALTTGSSSCTDGVVNSGNFYGATTNTEKELLYGIPHYSSSSDTYYLWVWLDAAETSSSSQNQYFNFSITGSCGSQAP